MKIKKSALSFIVCFLIIGINFAPYKALAYEEGYGEIIHRVQSLGLLDSSIEDFERDITREEFLKAVIEVGNLKEEAKNLNEFTIYPDIEANTDLSGYVNIAKDKALMIGMADGYFHPELGITYAEACTIMVKLLGYEDSDLVGVWPNNYLLKAYELKLTEDLAFKKKDRLQLWAAAVLFDRLLEINIKKSTTEEDDKTLAVANNIYTECIILDTYLTNDSLSSDEIVTNKGVFLYEGEAEELQPGDIYRFKIEHNNIIKVFGKIKTPSEV